MTFLKGKHPFINLKVQLTSAESAELMCMIDTGFSGGLALPKKLKTNFPEDEFVQSRYILADGSEVVVDTTYTTVIYNKQEKDVAVVFMDGEESLVGVEFLDQMLFCLDPKLYVGLLKSAFKNAFNILDKIAVFINDYYNMGLKENSLYFTTSSV